MAETTVTIQISNIEDRIKRHLSIIGKRIVDANGESLFDKITLSSAELDIIEDYISDAVDNIISNTRDFYSSYKNRIFTFNLSQNTAANATNLGNTFEDYCFQYTMGKWMDSVQPQLAKDYLSKADVLMQDIILMICNKKQPSAPSHNYTDSISIENFNSYVAPKNTEFDTTIDGVVAGTNTADIANTIAVNEKKAIDVSRKDGTIDDLCIVCHSDVVNVSSENGTFYVEGENVGTAIVTIYSYHKPEIYKQIPFTVYA